ncbi:hypothetical protein BGZ63DRAFT_387623 [Mariannaea sp. PMI_226]|nr:hypothetical protein BGZ63DRAFT_387623 [Mariannaea sp. PMI_226]
MPLVFFTTIPILGCWVPDSPTYCRDYGNKVPWIDVGLTNDDQSTTKTMTIDPEGQCSKSKNPCRISQLFC